MGSNVTGTIGQIRSNGERSLTEVFLRELAEGEEFVDVIMDWVRELNRRKLRQQRGNALSREDWIENNAEGVCCHRHCEGLHHQHELLAGPVHGDDLEAVQGFGGKGFGLSGADGQTFFGEDGGVLCGK
jgi:hypothetical protein